eukprot:1036295_1
MGVVDYEEATEYCLMRFGICKGFTFRRIVALLLVACYALDILFWVFISGNAWAIVTNALLFLSTVIGSLGIAIFNYIALLIFTVCTFLSALGSIITIILLSTNVIDAVLVGSNLTSANLIILQSVFASIQAIFLILLLNILKNIKIYATSGSVYMNFMSASNDFDI